jgi:hypothetical protein
MLVSRVKMEWSAVCSNIGLLTNETRRSSLRHCRQRAHRPVYQLLDGKQRNVVLCCATTASVGLALIDDVKRLMRHGSLVICTAPMTSCGAAGRHRRS